MFSGIVEETGIVKKIVREGENYHFTLSCSFVKNLKIDQSLAHNGVCLTVVDITDDTYTVTAIAETLQKTNLGFWKIGDKVTSNAVCAPKVCSTDTLCKGTWTKPPCAQKLKKPTEVGILPLNTTALKVI